MTTHLQASHDGLLPAQWRARLHHWAAARPEHIALRHKRRGRWKAWRWTDVLRETERLEAALRAQGVGPGTRLAISGAFEPTLLLLALAAGAGGASLVLLPPPADAAALAHALDATRPSHLYLQRREDRALFAGLDAAAAIAPLTLPPPSAAQAPQRVRPARGHGIAWVEEGSEWRDGLPLLLGHWLADGDSLAFPERTASAARDRRDVAPTVLLLSHGRLHGLADEFEARLAGPGSWRRRLCEWALRDPHGGLRRHLHAHLRRQFGFHRLRAVVHDGHATAGAHPAHAWLAVPAEARR